MSHSSGQLIPMRPRADRGQVERLAARIDRVRREWSCLFDQQRELERQFVENDLSESREAGSPRCLSLEERRRRLDELLEVHHRTRLLLAEEWNLWRILKALEDEGRPSGTGTM